MWVMGSQQRLGTVVVIWIIALLVRRWLRGSAPLRRATTPVLAAGALCAVLLGLSVLGGSTPTYLRIGIDSASRIALITIPAAYFFGLVRAQLDRAAVGRLILELDGITAPGQLRDALAHALGDASLQLGYWRPDSAGYVDARGAAFTLPDSPDRATTLLARDGRQVAVLVHDPALSQNRPLLDGVTAAAGMALENERLHAELRAQLAEVSTLAAEVQASRARIVEAGDQARRKLERNLHDGAQQRIVTVSVALAHAEQLAQRDIGEATRLISAARKELAAALDELRELARGLHPAIVNRGLRPALKSLVERSPIPVDLHAAAVDDLPTTVVATAYYVVAEALTNIARYSGASTARVRAAALDGWLCVKVEDDGAGGARLGPGSGLEGLRDRVDAIGGTFELTSPAGGGTRLSVRLPVGG
jgi:signal transduction histidine kinase